MNEQEVRDFVKRFGAEYFRGTRSRAQTFNLLKIALGKVSQVVVSAGARGALTAEELDKYQFASCVAAALVETMENAPLYDLAALEDQLNHNLCRLLQTRSATHVFTPAEKGGRP